MIKLILFRCLLITLLAVNATTDLVALRKNFIYEANGSNHTYEFIIKYNELSRWKSICADVSNQLGLQSDTLTTLVGNLLEELKYPQSLLDGIPLEGNTEVTISSLDAISSLLQISKKFNIQNSINITEDYFLLNSNKETSTTSGVSSSGSSSTGSTSASITSHRLRPDLYSRHSWLPSYFQANSFKDVNDTIVADIIIYQTIGAYTGGTTAMLLLHRTLTQLGYRAVICNATNRFHDICTNPAEYQLIITGEWCHQVFAEYYLNPDSYVIPGVQIDELAERELPEFTGRGVQYYLGFHHGQDSCRGSVAMSDCHYLAQLLTSKHLSGLYLGCPMHDQMRDTLQDLLRIIEIDAPFSNDVVVDAPSGGTNAYTIPTTHPVIKENLIVVDPDFFTDYPPETPLGDLQLPPGYQFVFAKGIPVEQMVLLLQRAKIVLDLGMPGPERLATECILLGCIPIISSRWTGASAVDYPGVRRVDHQNLSDIETALQEIADTYPSQLQSEHNARFFQYALSMWEKLHHTSDIVFGSAYIHFILYAKNLSEEYSVIFQLLSLLYLYPLCSVDIYVIDVLWFMRHHYAFMEVLQQAGYVRDDPLDPREYSASHASEQRTAYVRIKPLRDLESFLLATSADSHDPDPAVSDALTQNQSILSPLWASTVVLLAPKLTFTQPMALLRELTDLPVHGHRLLSLSEVGSGSMQPQSDAPQPAATPIGVVIAPLCHITNTVVRSVRTILNFHQQQQLQQEEQQCRVGHKTDSSSSNCSVIYAGSVISVCELLQTFTTATSPSVVAAAVVAGVVETSSWQSMRVFATSLGFRCV